MYLVFGSPHDPCCASVLSRLHASGRAARVIENPVASPARCTWRLDGPTPESQWAFGTDSAADIEGVLVRGGAWIDPAGWQPDDFTYMQAETHAALLAWLSSLPCPVVNRPTAASWYRPQLPLAAWRPALHRAGLDTPATLVTNRPESIYAFRDRLVADGAEGAVYAPLTSESQYLVGTNVEWTGLAVLAPRAPICLTYPHGQTDLACVVGDVVVWNSDPPEDASVLELSLRRFAREAGLVFVEVAIAPTAHGPSIVSIEPHPQIDRFTICAQELIIGALTRELTSASNGLAVGPLVEARP